MAWWATNVEVGWPCARRCWGGAHIYAAPCPPPSSVRQTLAQCPPNVCSCVVAVFAAGLIDYRTGADFLALTAPMAIVGAVVQSWLAGPALLLLFAAMMGFLAVLVFVRRQPRPTSSQPPCCMHEMTSTSAGSAAPAGVAQQAAAPSQDVEAVNPAGTGALDSTQDMLRDPTRLPSTSVSSVASGSGLGRGCVWRYFNASSPRQLVDSKGITYVPGVVHGLSSSAVLDVHRPLCLDLQAQLRGTPSTRGGWVGVLGRVCHRAGLCGCG